jgi:hypothetical protein
LRCMSACFPLVANFVAEGEIALRERAAFRA